MSAKIRGMLPTLMNHDSGPYDVKVQTDALTSENIQSLADHGIKTSVKEGKTMLRVTLTKDQIRQISDFEWVKTIQA